MSPVGPTILVVALPRRRLPILVVVLALLAAACSSGDDSTTADDPAAARAADRPHDFVADLVGGGQIDANDLAGRDVVLWFWAPW